MLKPPIKPLLEKELEISDMISLTREKLWLKETDIISLKNRIEELEKELGEVQKVISSYFNGQQ